MIGIKYEIYLGSTVLELSKLHMYKFFYNVLNPPLQDLMLHYMDTDSFVLILARAISTMSTWI